MIQMLRRRFIITAMVAISGLLLVLFGVINIGNIIANNHRTGHVLNNLIESEGLYTPPEEAMVQFSAIEEPERTWPQISELPSVDDMLGARYFFVRFDTNGEITAININHIYAVGMDEAKKMAQSVYDEAEDSGRMEQFEFRITQALPLTNTIR